MHRWARAVLALVVLSSVAAAADQTFGPGPIAHGGYGPYGTATLQGTTGSPCTVPTGTAVTIKAGIVQMLPETVIAGEFRTASDTDTAPSVAFTLATSSVTEGTASTTSIAIGLTLSAASGSTVTVPYTVSGTAQGSGVDHALANGAATIASGTSTTVTIVVTGDSLIEGAETVILTLGMPTNALLGSTVVHTCTIADNDNPTVSFASASSSQPESVANRNLTVNLSVATSNPVSVPFVVTGTASGADYSIDAPPLSIGPGATTASIALTVVNDTLDEDDETVIVTLGAPTNAVLGSPSVHTATIVDDDPLPVARFATASSSVTEGTASTNIGLTLTPASGRTANVTISAAAGTPNGATSADYSLGSTTIGFAVGATAATKTITIVNDTLDEFSETVVLTITGTSTASVGLPSTHTLTIAPDADPAPSIAFAAAASSGSEATAAVAIPVALSGASGKPVSATVTATNGPDVTGSDYSLGSATVSIASGTSGSVGLTIANDTEDEINETVTLTLSAPVNASLGAVTAHGYTIADDDGPTVFLTAASSSVGEATASPTTVVVQQSGTSKQAVVVPISIVASPAPQASGAGVDYTLSVTSVTFAANTTTLTQVVPITIVNDSLDEDYETLRVQLGTPTNASLGTTQQHTMTLTDNDCTVAITAPANGATFTQGNTVTISANASDLGGTIASVQFRDGATVIATDTASPFTCQWTGFTAGAHTLHAVATTVAGVTGTSSISVTVAANGSPTVATPATATPNPVTGTSAALSVLGADDGGAAALTYTWSGPAGVTFSANGTNAARTATANFTAVGTYPLTVIIRDQHGASVTNAVSVTVQATPFAIAISPTAAEILSCDSQYFAVTVRDQFNQIIANPTVDWSLSESPNPLGSVTNGWYVPAPTTDEPVVVSATCNGHSAGATVTVHASTSEVQWEWTYDNASNVISLGFTPGPGTSVSGGTVYGQGGYFTGEVGYTVSDPSILTTVRITFVSQGRRLDHDMSFTIPEQDLPFGSFPLSFFQPSRPVTACDPCESSARRAGGGLRPRGASRTTAPTGPSGVRYGTGEAAFSATDLSSTGLGGWGVTRSRTSRRLGGLVGGWHLDQAPFIRRTGDALEVVRGDQSSTFVADPMLGYRAVLDGGERLQRTNASPSEYVLIDGLGNRTFFEDLVTRSGRFLRFEDSTGIISQASWDAGTGRLTKITTTKTEGQAITEEHRYLYDGAGRIGTVERWRQVGTASATRDRWVTYAYNTGTASDQGQVGTLRLVQVSDASGVLERTYYRYWRPNEVGGIPGEIKLEVGTAGYARLVAAFPGQPNLDLLTDVQVKPYADRYFEYDPYGRVTRAEVSGSGCSCTGTSDKGIFTYAYSGSDASGITTTEEQRDLNDSVLYERRIRTNAAGQVLLNVLTMGGLSWCDAYSYDGSGRMTKHAHPSAVTGWNLATGQPTLSASNGLIELTTYGDVTDLAQGKVAGYLRERSIRKGDGGTPIPQSLTRYVARTVGTETVYVVADETVYRDTAGVQAQTTSYAYTWYPNTMTMESRRTIHPSVPTTQNGPGTADDEWEWYDSLGRLRWTKDGAGVIGYTAYDATTGAVVRRIEDADLAQTADFTIAAPGLWSTPIGGGLHLKTDTTHLDTLGRPLRVVDPQGVVTCYRYPETATQSQVRVYPGWTGTAPTGPVRISRSDRTLNYREELLASVDHTGHVASGLPDGIEPIQTAHAVTRELLDHSGRVTTRDEYHTLPPYTVALAYGTETQHFARTLFGYDHQGRQTRVRNAVGTITRQVFDARDRLVSEWVGTNDTPASGYWSPTNNTAPSNMTEVRRYEYDSAGVGDGNLTKVIEFPTGTSGENRESRSWYDWRNRQVATKAGILTTGEGATGQDLVQRPITYCQLDNLGQCVAQELYDGDNQSVAIDVAGQLTSPAIGLRRARTETAYDERGRAWQSTVREVSQTVGILGGGLITSRWFDRRGLLVAERRPGGLVAKTRYDGVGRAVVSLVSDGGGDTQWQHAFDAVGDRVLEQALTTFDQRGNAVLIVAKARMHDETATGDLGDRTTAPRARVSYRASYVDALSRPTEQVDVGTHGGVAWTRPASAPLRSDTVLVTSFGYDSAGRLLTTTDSRGIVTRREHDALGRVTKLQEAYDAAVNSGNPSGDRNRTTTTAYDGAGHVTALTAVMPTGQPSQTTAYVYGVTKPGSSIASNDLLAEVRYPDKLTGAASTAATDRETWTYNALGQPLSKQDGRSTTRTFAYDLVGRPLSDAVTATGGVDTTVLRIETAYDTAGRPYLFTSFNAATGGSVVNQVWRTFNGLGQMVEEYQGTTGTASTSSPKVVYGYSTLVGGNHSRPTSLTYPNGRVLTYGYDNSLDLAISRISSLIDAGGSSTGVHLEDYSYLGLGAIVRRAHPQPGVDWTVAKQTAEAVGGDSNDPYTGLDRFGRIVDLRWVKADNTHTDRFQYAYDRTGNKRYKNNLVNSTFSELYQANGAAPQSAYDPLGRMKEFRRGTLTASGTSGLDTVANLTDPDVADPTYGSQVWDLDHLGNWKTVTSDGTAQSRTHNAQNQLTMAGATSIGYDAVGNLTTQPGYTANTWDAWNRAASIRGVSYRYDALGRRIWESANGGRTFLYNRWKLIETRIGSATVAREQFINSRAYVDAVVLRDRDADASSSTGQLGSLTSGLEERLYFQVDREFSVTALLSVAGIIQERRVYDGFGNAADLDPAWGARSSSAFANAVGWTGRWADSTGLLYFRFRLVDPVLGRFTQRDDYYRRGLNFYAAYFAPGRMDPSGHEDFPDPPLVIPEPEPEPPKPQFEPLPKNGRELFPGGTVYTYTPAEANANAGQGKTLSFVSFPAEEARRDQTQASALSAWQFDKDGPHKQEYFDRNFGPVGTVGSMDELARAMAAAKGIRRLSLFGHGDPMGGGMMEFGAGKSMDLGLDAGAQQRHLLRPGQAGKLFGREHFTCNCEIWLLSCWLARTTIPQEVANASGCVVYAYGDNVNVLLGAMHPPYAQAP